MFVCLFSVVARSRKGEGAPVAFVEAGTVSPKIAIISMSGKKSPDLPGGSYDFCGADMAADDKKTLRLAQKK